ncbi:efflux RND transporter permease subunit [Pseudodesulfovibrio sediminis]|uniref:Multidrug efflux RND transporter permease subunit n=1 Tax=Pseudodesulfovibrio sediminis TaxID=2810563 RepID=A0ABM7P4W6_9BACT|nr:multidrug efflux RND transporter permease subunit [Pseudodesulfovibrio sediminis]BCS87939.1 multidrug efflux RND transporter permease subunit [Pseudodesulfovibrio sediminis]
MIRFFIDRPIFASVMAIIILLVGGLSIFALPIAQYPEIAPPSVRVSTTYTGADAQTVMESVATPIEEQVNGAQDMMYMSSISANDGSMNLTVTFELGRDLELATVDVQNRVNLASPQLPQEVRNTGVSVRKQSPDIVLIINLTSDNPAYNTLFLNNYAKINLYDALKRIQGVGDVSLFGDQDYGMRIWLNPDKLTAYGLTVTDVINAVKEQNVQAPAGQIGMPPSPKDQQFQMSLRVKGRLSEPEEFGNIIVKANEDGSSVKVQDVARVELGAKNYFTFARLNGQDTASILIYQLPGANALDVADAVYKTMDELSQSFPEGVKYQIPYNTTLFVSSSIDEVMVTLIEALVLVFLVVFIFLQNWRTTIIPMVCVPVSLIGTFALFPLLDFSINTLTLFGLVLAIGIVVDDAIVVVEATQRFIDDEGLSPKEATKAAMKQVTGPVIASTLVLIAVFIPVAFMGGITGQLYKQFALTLSVSVAISSINALTLSPALSALLLRPYTPIRGPLGWFFEKFNVTFEWVTKRYNSAVSALVRRAVLGILVVLIVVVGCAGLFKILPSGFVPDEDQGYFIVNAMLPEGASLERSNAVAKKVEAYFKDAEGVRSLVSLGGFSLLTGAYSSYNSAFFVVLDDWSERTTPELTSNAIMAKAQKAFWGIQEAIVVGFGPPPIRGLSSTGGLQFELQDKTGGSIEELAAVSASFMAEAKKLPEISNVFTTFSAHVPQYDVSIDREKAKKLGVPVNDVFQTLQTYLGGYYINDFNKYGRTYRVMAQAESQFRTRIEDLNQFYMRSADNQMVPLSTLSRSDRITGPEYVQRYNIYRTVEITMSPTEGYSSGQAMAALEALARKSLPQGYGYDWSGIAYQEKNSGGEAGMIFGLAIIMVFLVLAAQYESWTTPFAVIFCVPLGIFGAMSSQWIRGLENNVYAQIGLIMLIGLAAKNAIMIVEYAKEKHDEGMDLREAAMAAASLRFRPILMTSFAFILGVIPLVWAAGAGSASRHALGTSVFGGMIAATLLGVLVVPALYTAIQGAGSALGSKLRSGVANPREGDKPDAGGDT